MQDETPPQRPDGPTGLSGQLEFLRFTADPLAFLEDLTDRYPGATRLPMLGLRLIYLTDLEAIGDVLKDRDRAFSKDWTTRSLSEVLGRGLFTSEGELWRRQRKLVTAPLQRKLIGSYAPIMVRRARELVDMAKEGQVLQLRPAMMHLTIEVVAEALFGRPLGNGAIKIVAALDDALESYQRLIFSLRRFVPVSWPQPVRKHLRACRARMDAVIEPLIDAEEEAPTGDNLIRRLLDARDEKGRPMSRRQLLDEVVTMLLAGHETTAVTLCFALWHLARDRRLAETLRVEHRELQAKKDVSSWSDVGALPKTHQVIREVLRLYPPVSIFGREALRDTQVGPYAIEAGDQVLISPWLLHRDEDRFEAATEFRPERWSDELDSALPRYGYIPFGAGQRVCAGLYFAELEATLVAAIVNAGLDLEPLDEQLELEAAVTLRPAGNLPMAVERRH